MKSNKMDKQNNKKYSSKYISLLKDILLKDILNLNLTSKNKLEW